MTEFMGPGDNQWYRVSNHLQVYSPALLVYPDRIEENVRRMISRVNDVSLLRPHVKTHKMTDVIDLLIRQGIRKFKCATIAEAEMTAARGPDEVLLAYQPVGPNTRRFFDLKKKFPDVSISCLADCEPVLRQLSDLASALDVTADAWIDINTGMNRTGIPPGDGAMQLYRLARELPGLKAAGLHVYDGHLHESDYTLRKLNCDRGFAMLAPMISELEANGIPVRIVAGGTPTFPIHASRENVETSPGTAILWDHGYSSSFPDLDFLHAAVLLTRVISKPGKDLVCLDLGTKAVATEMPHPRIRIMGLKNYEFISHNEEHLVARTAEAGLINVGDVFYCLPEHICPTVDRYDRVSVVRNGMVTEEWLVEARKRQINI